MVDSKIPPHPPERFWQLILDDLALQMTRAMFNHWLYLPCSRRGHGRPTRAIALQDATLIIQVENQNAKQWIENRLPPTIQRTLDYFSDTPFTPE